MVDLFRMRQLMRQLKADERNVEAAMARATKITQGFSDMPHAPGVTDRVGQGAVELFEAERVRDETLLELQTLRGALEPLLKELPEDTREILRRRYINGDSPMLIAIYEHLSERHVFRLLRKGEAQIKYIQQP